MKVVVVGGTGLIGSGVVAALRERDRDDGPDRDDAPGRDDASGRDERYEVVSASPSTGVDTVTGEGVAEALADADVVIDVSRPHTYVDSEVTAFFTTSTANLLSAGRAAGVKHHVALSVVGCDRVPDSGFLSAKFAQERLIEAFGAPYTIVRATQFFEFVSHIADSVTFDGVARVPTGILQPIAAADVSTILARIADAGPLDGIREIAGPERFPMDELVRQALAARGDHRQVVSDPNARYFGTRLMGGELTPGPTAQVSATTYAEWLAASRS